MTGSAWLMLGTTCSIVTFFTVKFFLKVLRTPSSGGDGS